ncbi:adenylosuccinate synthetase family protein, partial [Vibrio parahaemolyticus EKP-021]
NYRSSTRYGLLRRSRYEERR